MTGAFLGTGWRFPVEIDDGRVAMSAYEKKVSESVWIVLATARGERVMRADFGCGMHDLVFAPNNAATSARVADEARHALIRWEPRIEVLDLTVAAQPEQPTTLLVQVRYRVRTTNNVFNLVYPFYLEGGER
jgi:phage baseplate assembly protein W